MKNIYLLIIVVAYILLMKSFWQTVSADEAYVDSQKVLKTADYERAIKYANTSITKNPNEPRYYYGRAKAYLATTVALNSEDTTKVKEKALRDLQTAQELNPSNLVTLRNMVPLYYFLASKDLKASPSASNVDQLHLSTTQNYYRDFKNYSPNDVGLYALAAKYEKRLGLMQDYQESIRNVKRLRPDLLEWYVE